MKRFNIFASLGFIIAAGLVTGCATSYDPAEVCTSNWIEPRTDRAIGYIQDDTSSVIKNLLKVAEKYAEGKTPGPLQLFSLSNSVSRLEKELKNGRGMKDLKILANTCDDPKIITDAMSTYIRGQGLPSGMVGFIENLGLYQNILAEATKDIGTKK